MVSKFGEDVLKELNKFRSNPKSIQHQCEVVRKGLSRLSSRDPFLNEIDSFVQSLNSMRQLPSLIFNEQLSFAARNELPNFRGRENYQKYRRMNALNKIVPEQYLTANIAMVADDGADAPINVLTKILLDKQDRKKNGRNILCDPQFTQVGIAHEVFEEDNMVILIFADKSVEEEKEYYLPEGDLTELKKVFDIFDVDGNEKLNIKEILENIDEKDDPFLYQIFKDVSDQEKCSWPKFAHFANIRMTERDTKEGLHTIFDLFIDDPKKNAISFEIFKKICHEFDSGLSEKQLHDIFQNAAKNGKEITFNEFQEIMNSPSKS